jgi:hypothetical protein
MAAVEVRYLVDNFSVDNPHQIEALFDHFDASASRVCEYTVVALGVEVPNGEDPLTAIRTETARLEDVVGLRAVDVDLDLVDEGEIAERLRKSRQLINLFAKGERGCDFPSPYALPGGRRVWTWAAVARWVRQYKQEWDSDAEPDHLSRDQQRELSAWLTARTKAAAAAAASFDVVFAKHGAAYTHAGSYWQVTPRQNADADWALPRHHRWIPAAR